MSNIPEGATHQWCPNDGEMGIKVWCGTLNRLSFYKRVDGEWWVYSEVTNWRKSKNSNDWFEEEISLGYFKEI